MGYTHHMKPLFLLGLVIIVGFLANYFYKTTKKNPTQDLKVGSILLVTKGYESAPGRKSKAKVLAIDEIDGVKVFSLKIEPVSESLYTTSSDGKKIDISRIGHMPLTETTLSRWDFVITGQEVVKEEELEGYKYWKDSKGGAF